MRPAPPQLGSTTRSVPAPDTRSVVVCGSDRTTLRVVSTLIDSGESVVAVVNPDSRHLERMSDLGARVIPAHVLSESIFHKAGVDTDGRRPSKARALVMMDSSDVRNVHSALTARDMDPNLRIVIEMINPRLGGQLRKLLRETVVLSGPSLAAPAFVADALDEHDVTRVEVGGRKLVAGPADRIKEPHLAVLADTTSPATPDLLPVFSDDPAADIVLGTAVRGSWRARDVRRAGWIVALRNAIDRRVRVIAMVMTLLVLIGTVAIHWVGHQDWLRSLYLALGAVTSAGIEDNAFVDARPVTKVIAVGGQLAGIVLVALLTAVVVDSLIGARLSRVLGGVRGRPRNHVIVCGLGTVGARALELLSERGVSAVGIDHDDDAPGVLTAKRLRIPVIIGDTSQEETLRSAGVVRCQAVLAITDGDITNLETGMIARELNSEARITLRMFDHDLAERVERGLNLGTSKSVSMLVAPAVAAAVANRLSQATVPAGRRVLLITEVRVEPGSIAVGRRLGELEERGDLRILAFKSPGADWDWRPTTQGGGTLRPVDAGTRIAVAATRGGLARFLLTTRAARGGGPSERMDP